jgi:uncharacterized protein YegJ (DUF2314 family)
MRPTFAILAVLIALGCGKKTDQPPVTYVEGDDPGMNAAIEKARKSVAQFVTAHKAPKPGQNGFSVKKAFTDGTNTEHMWLMKVTYDGKAFHGVLNNDPERVTNAKIGDKASVDATQISDWMYIDNKKLVGGYTLRAIRDKMKPDERAKMDKSLPFKIE